jgi:putative DNA primase/helicase
MIETTDPVTAFRETLLAHLGAAPPDFPPGEIVRFDDPDKPHGNRTCWAVVHLDGCPAGAFGNWRTGESHTWRADHRPASAADRERTRQVIEAAKRKRERERQHGYQKAADLARDMWAKATPATIEHPYLQRKHVPAIGLRVLYSYLLVPLTTVDGGLINLQRIGPDGQKRFLPGGRVTGAFWLLSNGLPDRGELYLCEGAATALTINAETRVPVVAAMNCGNLLPVAKTIRAARPSLKLTVCADNDHRTEGNPGLRYAREAARAVKGAVTWPTVCRAADCQCTDYNDMQHCGRAPA